MDEVFDERILASSVNPEGKNWMRVDLRGAVVLFDDPPPRYDFDAERFERWLCMAQDGYDPYCLHWTLADMRKLLDAKNAEIAVLKSKIPEGV